MRTEKEIEARYQNILATCQRIQKEGKSCTDWQLATLQTLAWVKGNL